MLSAQYGSAQAHYGNIQYASVELPPFVWGAWEIIGHYQPPLTEAEEQVIAVHQGNAPEPPRVEAYENNKALERLYAEAARKIARSYESPQKKSAPSPVRKSEAKSDDDDEAYFILM